MSYYVTGYYSSGKELGYIIFDSNTVRSVKMSSRYIVNNAKLINDLTGVRRASLNIKNGPVLISKETDDNTSINFNPAIINGNKQVSDSGTLVFIDFEKGRYGIVKALTSEVKWHSLNELKLDKCKEYNNLVYDKRSGLLDTSVYHITGSKYKRDIKICETVETEIQTSIYDTIEEVTDVKEVRDVKEVKDVRDVRDVKEVKEVKMETELETYKKMILLLYDDDTITIPLRILKELKFKVGVNLETSMNLDKRVSVGEITIDNVQIVLIALIDESLDTVRIQLSKSNNCIEGKDYTIECIRYNFNKWRANRRFLSIT